MFRIILLSIISFSSNGNSIDVNNDDNYENGNDCNDVDEDDNGDNDNEIDIQISVYIFGISVHIFMDIVRPTLFIAPSLIEISRMAKEYFQKSCE